jgi:sodium/hydrogen exchanger 8
VNDATSIVLFNSVQTLDFHNIDGLTVLKLIGTFLYLLLTSTALGIAVSLTIIVFSLPNFDCA